MARAGLVDSDAGAPQAVLGEINWLYEQAWVAQRVDRLVDRMQATPRALRGARGYERGQ